MRIHHVFPYDPRHLGVKLDQWWDGQARRWPLAAAAQSRYAGDTVVHVISRRSATWSAGPLVLQIHGTLYDNAKWHHWGDDWSMSLGRALSRTKDDDIVVVHLETYAAARLTLRYSYGARCVLVLHGRGRGSWEDHFAADRVVVLRDQSLQELLQSGLAPERLTQVVPSIDRRIFSPDPAPGPSGGRLRLGYVGRLEESKGVFELAEVLRQLSDVAPELECLGSAPSPAERSRAEQVFNGQRVNLTGELPPAAVAERMRAWDVLVIPSYTEGMPLSALEALSCGTPVVAVHGVLPATLSSSAGVVTVERDQLAAGVRRAARCIADVDAKWIPDHDAGGRTWDAIYDSLLTWHPRYRPSPRPLVGRMRRVRRPSSGSASP